MHHSRRTIQGAIEHNRGHPLTGGEGRPPCRERVRAKERQTDKQIDALCTETVACLHVSACRGRRCVRELVTREASVHRVHTRTRERTGSVPIMGMQVAKQVPFIHVRRALVVYHLQFPIYHLPSSSSERVSTTATLSLSRSPFLFADYR